MALNPYFLQGSPSEQNLVQDLINEQLKIYGVDVYYIPRRYIAKNTVCLLYTSPSPRDRTRSRMPSSA